MLEGLRPSVGTVGDALDNALCETTIGLYKTECVREGSPFRAGPIRTLTDLENITSAWVSWYNERRHRALRPGAWAIRSYNALAENLWSTIKIELIYWPATTFATRVEARAALFRYIDGWYNPRRIQAGLGGLSPDEYEAAWQARQHQPHSATLQPETADPR